ncbi:MAG: hypothetical protein H0V01_14760 [Bacteroidetes bacterium]|nr:hypothetical protein [Bacteroidota bacterium]HET6242944.1 hypothetical protein [Bacteroidia bacterium]
MNKVFLLIFVLVFFSLFSCHPVSSPSGKANKNYNSDPSSGGFSKSSTKKSRKAPQMGFYEKKNKTNIFVAVKHKVTYVFAGNDKKHKLNNDQRSSSQSYSNKKQGEQTAKMNKSFVKGKKSKGRKKNKSSDSNSDSFSSSPKKKKSKK